MPVRVSGESNLIMLPSSFCSDLRVFADLQAKFDQMESELHRFAGNDLRQALTSQALLQTQKQELEDALRGVAVSAMCLLCCDTCHARVWI